MVRNSHRTVRTCDSCSLVLQSFYGVQPGGGQGMAPGLQEDGVPGNKTLKPVPSQVH